jgi:uncharacterized cysteine cluster protein YcgN (CxxCxxCC family)
MRLAFQEKEFAMAEPFWKTVPLNEMTDTQWESLCDGCGKCCLIKLQDADTEEIVFTDIVCHLLDMNTRQCTQYAKRCVLVSTCVKLTSDNLDDLDFMPPSCAYRLLAEGADLPDWHPLVSGTRDSVVAADMSVDARVISEADFDGDFEDQVVNWPIMNA